MRRSAISAYPQGWFRHRPVPIGAAARTATTSVRERWLQIKRTAKPCSTRGITEAAASPRKVWSKRNLWVAIGRSHAVVFDHIQHSAENSQDDGCHRAEGLTTRGAAESPRIRVKTHSREIR